MKEEKSVGIWIRVSTEDKAKGDSPEHHEKRARLYAESKGWKVKEVYHLEAVNGRSVMDHPETKRMLGHIRSGHVQAVIFSKLARLGRNTRELLDVMEIFREYNVDMVSLQESIDTSAPSGRLLFTFIAGLANCEQEEVADRMAASVPMRAKLGKSLGGVAPFGYRWVNKKLVLDPKEASVRKLMYDLFLAHHRKRTVARLLNEQGYRMRNGGKFSDTTIDRLLHDPIAKGLRRVNYTKNSGDKKHWKLKPSSEWFFTEVEPLISEDTWNQCEQILVAQQRSKQPIARQAVNLFSGLTFCACGKKMYVPSNSPKYTCSKCRNKIGTDDLEVIFHEQLKNFTFSSAEIEEYTGKANQTLNQKESLLTNLQDERTRIIQEMDSLVRLHHKGELPEIGFGRHYAPLEERLEQIENELPEILVAIDLLKVEFLSSDAIIENANGLYDRWPTLEPEAKRRITEIITQKITIDRGNVSIKFNYLPSAI